MSTIQDTFFKIQDMRKKQREIRSVYREALQKSYAYQELVAELRTVKEKKKKVEDRIKEEYARELEKLDDLSDTMKAEQDRISDMVLSSLSKGEIIKVHDVRNYAYDPVVKVSFRKSDEQEGL